MTDFNRVVGIVGWKNSGKTTLIVELIKCFRERGISVSTIKHAHHAFDIDRPGKDSFLHREAGAREVLVASSSRWALMHELKESETPSLRDLAVHLGDTDIVLAEGFKREPHPKIEVHRDHDAELLALSDTSIRAVVTQSEMGAACPVVSLDRRDIGHIADFIWKIVE